MQAFRIHHQLQDHHHYTLFEGEIDDDQQSIWIKTEKVHDRLKENQTRLGKIRGSSPYFRGVIFEGEHQEHGWVTLFENRGFQLSQDWLPSKPMVMSRFLDYSFQLLNILSDLHDQGLLLNNFNPQAFALDEEQHLYPLDLSKVTLVGENLDLEDSIESLAYRSPEQCQYMNRQPDERSDLYELGVLFYRMLVGELPFKSKDTLEIIHQHIASEPLSPHELRQGLSENLSKVVMKLLEKNPDMRYQSLWGLMQDLKTFQLESFSLGSKDISPRLKSVPKLYGREEELLKLQSVLNHARNGEESAVVISGYSGVGKTTLVDTLSEEVKQDRGLSYFAKIDQFRREQNFAPFIQLLSNVLYDIIEEVEEYREQWKTRILNSVGASHLALLQEMIPAIKVLYNQSFLATSAVNLQDEQQRRRIAMFNLCKALVSRDEPFLLFIDDLQWADQASLDLFEDLVREPIHFPLIMVGSYRSNEVDKNHPLVPKLEILGPKVELIELKAFSLETTISYVSDQLGKSGESLVSLCKVIYRKTEGNPFFVKIFLDTLVQSNHLKFSNKDGWLWELEHIEKMKTSENVVEVMIDRLLSFSKSIQSALSVAACFGSSFPIYYQHFIRQVDQHESPIESDLDACISAGFLNKTERAFHFAHDRIQEAAYQLLSDDQKAVSHATIAEVLFFSLNNENLMERIYPIVNHLNAGYAKQNNQRLKREVLMLNAIAGKKAKRNSAFKLARKYFNEAIKEIGDEHWKGENELVLSVYRDQIEVEYILGEVEASRLLVDQILMKTYDPIERALSLNTLVYQYTSEGKYDDAIRAGQEGLGYLEYNLPLTKLKVAIQHDLKDLIKKLKDKSESDLVGLPPIKDVKTKTIQKLLTNIQPTAYMSNLELYNLLALRLALLNLEHGSSPETSKAFVTLANVLFSSLEQRDLSKFFTDLWQTLDLQETNPLFRPRCKFIYIAFLHHWMAPMRQSYHHFQDGYQLGMEIGDYQYVGYLIGFGVANLFNSSYALDELSRRIVEFQNFVSQQKQALPQDAVRVYQWTVSYLSGQGDDHLVDSEQDLTYEFEERKFGICNYYVIKSFCLLLDDQKEEALEWILKADELADFVKGTSVSVEILVLKNILKLELAIKNGWLSKKVEAEYKEDMNKLCLWESSCYENFNFKRYLLEALWYILHDDEMLAVQAFDDAIEGAAKFGFLQYEALAGEMAAKFWIQKGKDRFSKIYLSDAYIAYRKWGCHVKLEQFKKNYTFAKDIFVNLELEESENTRSANRDGLDLLSINKASRMISEALELSQLTHRSLSILMESAGADKGALVFPSEQSWEIRAVSRMRRGKIQFLNEGSYRSQEILPWKMLNEAARKREYIAFNQDFEAE